MRLLLLLSAGVVVSAQIADHRLEGYRTALAAGPQGQIARIADLLDVGKNSRAFLYYMAGDRLAQDRFQRFVQILESARMDKQAGAGSLVSKPSATAVLSAAIETGGLTTLRGDPVGIGRILLGEEPFPFCEGGPQSCDTRVVKA